MDRHKRNQYIPYPHEAFSRLYAAIPVNAWHPSDAAEMDWARVESTNHKVPYFALEALARMFVHRTDIANLKDLCSRITLPAYRNEIALTIAKDAATIGDTEILQWAAQTCVTLSTVDLVSVFVHAAEHGPPEMLPVIYAMDHGIVDNERFRGIPTKFKESGKKRPEIERAFVQVIRAAVNEKKNKTSDQHPHPAHS
jgi:hypothetical protein